MSFRKQRTELLGIMLTGADIQQLKDYVAGPASGIQNRVDSTVLLQVSHSNLSARFMEIRLDMHVRMHLGPPPSFSRNGQCVASRCFAPFYDYHGSF